MKKISKIITLPLFILITINILAQNSVVVLHTNDMHSQIPPITSGSHRDQGGMLRLSSAIEHIRSENNHVLLFDCGDFWQGDPIFNLFSGKAEITVMNAMKYDASTVGNHQFDLGIDTLAKRIQEADFQVVLANYDLTGTPLETLIKPYTIFEKGGLKIGVIGVCTDITELVQKNTANAIKYHDPVPIVNTLAKKLKKNEHCDLVIVLSHLGYENFKIDDIRLAQQTENVDIILGGHTHTPPEQVNDTVNKNGEKVIIRQMEKSGLFLGRIDLNF